MIHDPMFEGHRLPRLAGQDYRWGWFAKIADRCGRGRDDQLVRAKWGERRIIARSLRYVAGLIWWAQARDSGSSKTVSMTPIAPREGGVSEEGLDPFDDRGF